MAFELPIGISHTVVYLRGHQLAAERGETRSLRRHGATS
jgi:hypothetical protein